VRASICGGGAAGHSSKGGCRHARRDDHRHHTPGHWYCTSKVEIPMANALPRGFWATCSTRSSSHERSQGSSALARNKILFRVWDPQIHQAAGGQRCPRGAAVPRGSGHLSRRPARRRAHPRRRAAAAPARGRGCGGGCQHGRRPVGIRDGLHRPANTQHPLPPCERPFPADTGGGRQRRASGPARRSASSSATQPC